MKRLSVGIVAVATALSLSTAPALAADSWLEDSTANVSGPHRGSAAGALVSPGSSVAHLSFYGSSYGNDVAAGYPIGTTADILWGTGIAATILGALALAVQSGIIPIPGL